jgi:hypothetical protein
MPNTRLNQKKSHREWSIYERIWDYLKQFPQALAVGAAEPPDTSGSAAAALISAGIGCFMMMVTHHLAETSTEREQLVRALGKWIPGSNTQNPLWGSLGTYAGEETMLLVTWVMSWAILHSLYKHKQVKTQTIFTWMFGLFVAATVMCWHPLFPYLPLS